MNILKKVVFALLLVGASLSTNLQAMKKQEIGSVIYITVEHEILRGKDKKTTALPDGTQHTVITTYVAPKSSNPCLKIAGGVALSGAAIALLYNYLIS